MGWLKNLFAKGTGGASAISETVGSVGTLAKDLRQAITGDLPAEQRADLLGKTLDIMSGVLSMQSNVIVAEAQSQSWLTRSWRPITMLAFVALIILDATGALHSDLPQDVWTVIKVGLGGYVAGRSLEKISDKISKTMEDKK